MTLTIAPLVDTWLWWPLVVAPLFVALCTFLGGLAWAAAVATSRWSRSRINQVIVEIELKWLRDAIAAMPGTIPAGTLYCLVVRFGTDAYRTNVASEQERYQGRLLNRVVEIKPDPMILNLPVHRKLGTQFKLYYLLPDEQEAGALWEALKTAQANPLLGPAHAVHKIVLDEDKPAGRRCWFRLAACGTQETIDKFATSYFAASQMRGFERRNRWKPPWWIRKDQPE